MGGAGSQRKAARRRPFDRHFHKVFIPDQARSGSDLRAEPPAGRTDVRDACRRQAPHDLW